jgi:hypothetical protein
VRTGDTSRLPDVSDLSLHGKTLLAFLIARGESPCQSSLDRHLNGPSPTSSAGAQLHRVSHRQEHVGKVLVEILCEVIGHMFAADWLCNGVRKRFAFHTHVRNYEGVTQIPAKIELLSEG